MHNTGSQQRGRRRYLRAVVFALPLALILGGCSPQLSAPDSQDIPIERKEKTVSEDGWSKILEAVEKSRSITKFGLQGTLETREQNKFHRSKVYGHLILPDQIVMSQEVDGRSYYIFQDTKSAYYREEGVWRPMNRIPLPDTWASLERLSKAQSPKVYRLEDMSILTAKDTELYQFEANAVELAGLPAPQGKMIPSLYTIYIDKKTRYIRRIDVQSTSAVDDVGTIISNATLQFFDIKSDNVKVEMPPALKQQLKNQP